MASVTFTVDGSSKLIPLHKWRFVRQAVRTRHRYWNGGSGSSYRAARVRLECEWDHLPATEYALLVAVIDGIRSGAAVLMTTTTGLSFFDNTAISGGKAVDVEDDDVIESAGDLFEFMPARATFIITEPMGLTHST